MMNGKELYDLILSNIDIFKESLIEIKKSSQQGSDEKSSMQSTNIVKDYLKIENGVKYVSQLCSEKNIISRNNFIFDVVSLDVISHLLKNNIPVYKINAASNCSDYFCKLEYLNYVLENLATEVYAIEAPKHSIPSSLLCQFVKSIEVNIKHFDIGGAYNISSFLYEHKGIDEYGAFASINLYKLLQWNFEIVEQYKDKLNWKLLIEYSDLIWDENKLNRYFSYIPFSVNGKDYYKRFRTRYTISDFSNFKISSKQFIVDHYQDIDIQFFLETAQLKLSGEELKSVCQLITSMSEIWIFCDYDPNSCAPAGSQIFPIHCLTLNSNFIWTEELLLVVFDVIGNFDDFLSISDERRRISLLPLFQDFFIKHPSVSQKIDTKLFSCKLIEGKNLPFDSYSMYFTVDNILQKWEKWNEILTNKFDYTHRLSRDRSFEVYKVRTMWNYFNENMEVSLSYDICNVLNGKKIVIGGEYEKENAYQRDIDSGFITKEIDALDFFAHHPIQEESMEKIMSNKKFLKLFLLKKNKTLIEYILQQFFSDYSPSDFFSAIEKVWSIETRF